MRKRAAAASVLALIVVGWYAKGGLGASTARQLVLRGQQVDGETFSFDGLVSPTDKALVADVRRQLLKTCMRERGFDYPALQEPEGRGDPAYSIAITGDDGTRTKPPPPHQVVLPNGEQFPLGLSWTADSCMYRVGSTLAEDPFLREALQVKMMLLASKADREMTKSRDFEVLRHMTATCRDQSVDGDDLMGALRPPSNRPGSVTVAHDACLGNVLPSLRSLRSQYHYAAALDEQALVTAWVHVADREIDIARRYKQTS